MYWFCFLQEDQYIKLGNKTLQEAWDLYQKKDWKLQKQSQNDFVYSRVDPKGRKMFKVHVSELFNFEDFIYRYCLCYIIFICDHCKIIILFRSN